MLKLNFHHVPIDLNLKYLGVYIYYLWQTYITKWSGLYIYIYVYIYIYIGVILLHMLVGLGRFCVHNIFLFVLLYS